MHLILYSPNSAVYAKGALMPDAWFMMLWQVVLSPLLVAFDPAYFMKAYKRSSLRKSLLSGEKSTMTQEDCNKAFENPEFEPAFAYAAICRPLFSMVFFQPILPLGCLLGIVSLVLSLFAWKYKFTAHSKLPISISSNIAFVTLYLINLLPFVYAVSSVYLLAIPVHF